MIWNFTPFVISTFLSDILNICRAKVTASEHKILGIEGIIYDIELYFECKFNRLTHIENIVSPDLMKIDQ